LTHSIERSLSRPKLSGSGGTGSGTCAITAPDAGSTDRLVTGVSVSVSVSGKNRALGTETSDDCPHETPQQE